MIFFGQTALIVSGQSVVPDHPPSLPTCNPHSDQGAVQEALGDCPGQEPVQPPAASLVHREAPSSAPAPFWPGMSFQPCLLLVNPCTLCRTSCGGHLLWSLTQLFRQACPACLFSVSCLFLSMLCSHAGHTTSPLDEYLFTALPHWVPPSLRYALKHVQHHSVHITQQCPVSGARESRGGH